VRAISGRRSCHVGDWEDHYARLNPVWTGRQRPEGVFPKLGLHLIYRISARHFFPYCHLDKLPGTALKRLSITEFAGQKSQTKG
jgi:hypothetical protein